jgi:hypothetical protein
MSRKKRSLPRHVDGRIMIGPFHIIKFFLWLPIALSIVIISFMNRDLGPFILFLSIISLGVTALPFVEVNAHKESGIDVIKELIKYELKGTEIEERSSVYVPIHKKFITNRKVQEIKSRKSRDEI